MRGGVVIDLRVGDCLDVLATLDDESVDAVVTDPPYGIGFMGRQWDSFAPAAVAKRAEQVKRKSTTRTSATWPEKVGEGSQGGGVSISYDESARGNRAFQEWCQAWAAECLRILKPGGHFVSFSGTRTYHRLVAGVEDAGFEIRDQLAWMFGSGFPKSLDVAKAIDRSLGERPVGTARMNDIRNGDYAARGGMGTSDVPVYDTEPVTDEAKAAAGLGTALKPGYEPVVLARKPLGGTVAATVLEHGTGALNIDGCRIGTEGGTTSEGEPNYKNAVYGRGMGGAPAIPLNAGRWPSNVALDEDAAAMLDEQTGILVSGPESDRGHRRNADSEAQRNAYGGFQGQEAAGVLYGDSGGASRFYYCAKADNAERHAGLTKPSLFTTDAPERNGHPTVKPIDLMRWLCRLVTPAGGLIVDPFLGSGTTGIAAALEGFRFLGIEREAEYMAIAQARISHWAATQVEAA